MELELQLPFVQLLGSCEVKCPSSLINAIFAQLLQLLLVCQGESHAWEVPDDVIAEPF